MPVLDPDALIEDRTNAIRLAHYGQPIEHEKAQLDLSGGVDSAVMAALLVDALGPQSVILVHSAIHTDPAATARAEALAAALNCPLINVEMTGFYDDFLMLAEEVIAARYGVQQLAEAHARCDQDKTVLGSIRSTLRAPIGRAFNRLLGGGLRHGTGNECEDRFLRFYQKGGDGEVDSNPLAMLSKTEVYQLAFALGNRMACAREMRAIIEATPTPDLWGEGTAHSDESELLQVTGAPFTYGRINPETGKVLSYGTIECMNRFLDMPLSGFRDFPFENEVDTVESLMFGDASFRAVVRPDQNRSEAEHQESCDFLGGLLGRARASGLFKSPDSTLLGLLFATIRMEYQTRHKANNLPTYGTRKDLIEQGILTNDLLML